MKELWKASGQKRCGKLHTYSVRGVIVATFFLLTVTEEILFFTHLGESW